MGTRDEPAGRWRLGLLAVQFFLVDTAWLALLLAVVACVMVELGELVAWWAPWVYLCLGAPRVVAVLLILDRGGVPVVRATGVARGRAPFPDSALPVRGGRSVHPRLAELLEVVEGVAATSGAPVPTVVLWPNPLATALTTGWGAYARLYVSTGLLDALGAQGLRAVVEHEMQHLDPLRVARETAWSAARSLVRIPLLVGAVLLAGPWSLVVGLVTEAARCGLLPARAWSSVPGAWSAVLDLLAVVASTSAHRREVVADVAAARRVGAPAVLQALEVLEAAAPSPAQVRAATPSTPDHLVEPLRRRLIVPLRADGERGSTSPRSTARRLLLLHDLAGAPRPSSRRARRLWVEERSSRADAEARARSAPGGGGPAVAGP